MSLLSIVFFNLWNHVYGLTTKKSWPNIREEWGKGIFKRIQQRGTRFSNVEWENQVGKKNGEGTHLENTEMYFLTDFDNISDICLLF